MSTSDKHLSEELVCLQSTTNKLEIFNSTCKQLPTDFHARWFEQKKQAGNRKNDNDEMKHIDKKEDLNIENIKHGATVTGVTSNIVCVLWALALSPTVNKYFTSDLYLKELNHFDNTQGMFIQCFHDLLKQICNTESKMNIDTFIQQLQKYGPGTWKHCTYNSWYSMTNILHSFLTLLHNDLAVSSCDNEAAMNIDLLESNEESINKYFTYLRSKHGHSFWQDKFAIEVIDEKKCCNCNNTSQECHLYWFLTIPVNVNMVRCWIIDATKDEEYATCVYLPSNVLKSQTMAQLIKMFVKEKDNTDVDKIDIINNHFITVNNHWKYFVFLTAVCQYQNNYKGFCYKGYTWQSKFTTACDYSNQVLYKLVIQNCTEQQKQTVNIQTQQQIQFTSEIYVMQQTNTIIPKTLTTIQFPIIGNDTNVHPETQIVNQTIEEIKCPTEPSGDEIWSLNEHIEQLNKYGYINNQHCINCNTKQKMIIKNKIHKLPSHLILYIDQNDTQYYDIAWSFNQEFVDLPITLENKNKYKLQTQCFISQTDDTEYSVQWKSNDKKWHTMNAKGHVTINQQIEDLTNVAAKVCLAIYNIFKFNPK